MKLITKDTGFVWPEKGMKITDSEKTNITVWYGSLGKSAKAKTTFEYWTRQKVNPKTENSFFEFHYACYFENMDPTSWKTDGTEVLECNVGFHQYQTVLDWALIKMNYLPSYDTKGWSCDDAHQFFNDRDVMYHAEINSDEEQNCNNIQADSKIFV